MDEDGRGPLDSKTSLRRSELASDESALGVSGPEEGKGSQSDSFKFLTPWPTSHQLS